LKHGTEVKVFLATAETVAALRLLGADTLNPGEEGWVQLELRDPLVAVRGDRYILRRPSPSETLGGGLVVDPHPSKRHKRFDESLLKGLESLSKGSPAEVLFQAALALGAATARETVAKARLESESAAMAIKELIDSGMLVPLEAGEIPPSAELLIAPAQAWNSLKDSIVAALAAYHKNYPLRRGMPREELKSRLKLAPRLFNAALKRLDLQDGGAWLALPGHAIHFSTEQRAKVDVLLKRFAAAPYTTPPVKECQTDVGEDVYAALVELGELAQVSAEVVFQKTDYEKMIAAVRAAILKNGQVTAAEVRDLFGTSRKYALALLEHLDAIAVTIRDGDFRRLK
jgi:selenocysteine-specific elongation factor